MEPTANLPHDKRKQSLYFPAAMLAEIRKEADRQERSLSWIVQRAWVQARASIRALPGLHPLPEAESDGAHGDAARQSLATDMGEGAAAD